MLAYNGAKSLSECGRLGDKPGKLDMFTSCWFQIHQQFNDRAEQKMY